ncbi:MAG: acetoin utilization protein AcuC [Chlorobia bacterium]|nr:acetoin utilization protein AcuC [Fimbriimonadaceae bacterium]
MLPHFYYSPDILRYNFGPQHPLKPERLRRTIELLDRYGVKPIDPGPGRAEDLLRVHDEEYVDAVRRLDPDTEGSPHPTDEGRFGFGLGDNPVFAGMFGASLAYVAATVKAAEAVRDGAPLAFGIGGGLHHAHRAKASGFCIFDDPAIACHILLEKFNRVAYVDIDVHHGDGVQWIFYNEPRVLTCSIHEEGRTLFPGTGFTEETGEAHSSLNVPVMAYTTGDVWLEAFERGVLPGLENFQPQAIVLQLGTDTHGQDPLGHVRSTAQHWMMAVRRIKELGLPVVAVGGGGYNLTTVPRMWSAACLTLGGVPFEDKVPEDLAEAWSMPTYFDEPMDEHGIGREYAKGVLDWLAKNLHPVIGKN